MEQYWHNDFAKIVIVQRHLISIVVISLLFQSCDQQELRNLQYTNHNLKSSNAELTTELESYMKTFNDVETNLAEIKARENLIDLKKGGGDLQLAGDLKQSIIQDVRMINGLMVENKNKLTQLMIQLSESKSEFKKMVVRLNKRLQERENEIAELKVELESRNIENEQLTHRVSGLASTVDTLKLTTERQEMVIQTSSEMLKEKDDYINEAFVTIGSYKDLKVKEVIKDEGGILGIGSSQELRGDFNPDAFRQVDIRTTSIIPIDAKKLKLITSHPEGSYELFRNGKDKIEALQILKPEEFWNSSKYLVLMTN